MSFSHVYFTSSMWRNRMPYHNSLGSPALETRPNAFLQAQRTCSTQLYGSREQIVSRVSCVVHTISEVPWTFRVHPIFLAVHISSMNIELVRSSCPSILFVHGQKSLGFYSRYYEKNVDICYILLRWTNLSSCNHDFRNILLKVFKMQSRSRYQSTIKPQS